MACVDTTRRLHCGAWHSATWHNRAIPTKSAPPHIAWVPCPARQPQLLIHCADCTVQLFTAPALTVQGAQQVPFCPQHCACSQEFVGLCDFQSLHLFRLQHDPASGQPFLLALCSLPQDVYFSQPSFSPSGTSIARMLPASARSGVLEVELVSLNADHVGGVTCRSVTPGLSCQMRQPLWSADGCSIALTTSSWNKLRLVGLLGE